MRLKLKRSVAFLLAVAVLISFATNDIKANAAFKPSVSKKKITLTAGTKKTVKVKSPRSGTVTIKSLNPYFADVVKEKKKVSKSKPATFTIKGKYEGYAIFSVVVKYKKAYKKRKTFSTRLHVYIKAPKTTAKVATTSDTSTTKSAATTNANATTADTTSVTTENATTTEKTTTTEAATTTTEAATTTEVTTTEATTEAASSGMSAEETAVYNAIMAKKADYPEGMPFTDNDKYVWVNVTGENVKYNLSGCAAFAAIMSDAAFGAETKATKVDNPDPKSIKVGDIIRFNNNTHSAIVIGRDGDYFTIAEGNYNSSVHWGRKIPKTTAIDFIFTRWSECYTVTYTAGADDATGMPNPSVVMVPKNGDCKVTLPAAPSREGYRFIGWIVNDSPYNNPGKVITVSKNMTIRARWERDVVVVAYEPGAAGWDAVKGMPNYASVSTGGTLTVTSTVPKWEGHVFSGWYISGYPENIYVAGDKINSIYSKITLNAAWDQGEPGSSTTVSAAEQNAIDKLAAFKALYPEGSASPKTSYVWKGFASGAMLNCHDSYALCAYISDEIFGAETTIKTTSIGLNSYNYKVGDIIFYSNSSSENSRYAMIVEVHSDHFVVLEADDGYVHWGTEVTKQFKGVYGIMGVNSRY